MLETTLVMSLMMLELTVATLLFIVSYRAHVYNTIFDKMDNILSHLYYWKVVKGNC